MRIAVAGGAGPAGRKVVAELTDAGHEAVVLARPYGVDLTTGVGLAARLAGVAAVVDIAGPERPEGDHVTGTPTFAEFLR